MMHFSLTRAAVILLLVLLWVRLPCNAALPDETFGNGDGDAGSIDSAAAAGVVGAVAGAVAGGISAVGDAAARRLANLEKGRNKRRKSLGTKRKKSTYNFADARESGEMDPKAKFMTV